MSKILVFTYGYSLAHVTRPLEIALVLRQMGYDIIFAGEGDFISLITERGFKVEPVSSFNRAEQMKWERNSNYSLFTVENLTQQVNEDLELLKRIKPDFILTDFRISMRITKELIQIPVISIINSHISRYAAVKNFLPDNSIIVKAFGKFLAKYIIKVKNRVIPIPYIRVFRKVWRNFGISKKSPATAYEFKEGDLNLVADLPEFNPVENLPDNYKVIGPLTADFLSAVDDNVYSKIETGKDLVYITEGSTGDIKSFANMEKELRQNNIQLISSYNEKLKKDSVNSNTIFLNPLVNPSKVLEKCKAIVCHGGSGTIYQALRAGVPVICIPYNTDQQINAYLVEKWRLGISIPVEKSSSKTIKDAILKLINNPLHGQTTKKFAGYFKGIDAATAGAMYIDEFIKNFFRK